MKVEQLIAELQKLPAGTEVVIFDHHANLSEDDGEDGYYKGIYANFEVAQEETIKHVDECPVAVIAFKNPDYDKDGRLIHCDYLDCLDTIADLEKECGRT